MKRWKERLIASVLLLGLLAGGAAFLPDYSARPAPVLRAAVPAAVAKVADPVAEPEDGGEWVEADVAFTETQPPPSPQVRLPATPPAPQPPQPVPGAATKLNANQWYIIDSDLALVVLTSPPGLVGVGKEAGPVKMRGWFVDAAGVETRTYQGKFIYCLDATGVGKVELLIIRSDNQEVIRRWLDVDNGGPAPKPDPGPGPGPKPDPGPAPIPGAGLRVLMVYETADAAKLPAAQQSILFGQPIRDYLNAKCAIGPDGKTKEWRIWDANVATGSVTKIWQDAMKRPRQSLPWLVLSNGTGGYEGPLPATVDDMKKLIDTYAK